MDRQTEGEGTPRPERPWASERSLFWVAVLLAVAFTAIFSAPLANGSVYTEDDLIAYYLPMKAFYQDCLSAGDAFTWLPGLDLGLYLHGEGEAGLYHPLHWLLYRFLPLNLAFNLNLLLLYPFLLLGTYLLCRRMTLPPSAALFGALTFTFCGFFVSHYVHLNMVAVAVHIPWLLFFLNVALTTKNPTRALWSAVAIALLTASQFLHGFPQAIYWSLLAEGAYGLFLWPASRRPGRYLHAVWAKGLAVLLGAVQWLPTKDMLEHSYRAVISPEVALSDSIHPLNLLQFISPYLFHQRTYAPVSWDAVYIGSATLLLVVWLTVRVRRLDTLRPLALGLLGFAAVTFAFAMGRYGHVYGWKAYIPVINGFRSPSRLIVLTHLGLVLAAAIAYADLHRGLREGRRASLGDLLPLAILPVLSWGIVLGVWAIRLNSETALGEFVAGQVTAPRNLAAGALLLTCAAGLVALSARGASWALAALLLFASIDIGYYSFRHKDRMPLDDLIASIEMPPETTAYRVSSYYQPNFGVNTPILRGVKMHDGYITLKEPKRLDYSKTAALRVASVGWRKLRYSFASDALDLPDRGERWERVADPMPRVRLVGEARVSERMAEEIAVIDLVQVALVDAPLDLDGGPPGEAELIEDRPGRLRIQVRTDKRQLLVVSERYHHGWVANTAKGEVPILPVYGDLMGCVVGPGEDEVTFRFAPRSLSLGKGLTLAGLVLTLLYAGGFPVLRGLWLRRETEPRAG